MKNQNHRKSSTTKYVYGYTDSPSQHTVLDTGKIVEQFFASQEMRKHLEQGLIAVLHDKKLWDQNTNQFVLKKPTVVALQLNLCLRPIED